MLISTKIESSAKKFQNYWSSVGFGGVVGRRGEGREDRAVGWAGRAGVGAGGQREARKESRRGVFPGKELKRLWSFGRKKRQSGFIDRFAFGCSAGKICDLGSVALISQTVISGWDCSAKIRLTIWNLF